MDIDHLKAFSPDRKLFAVIQNDGKLKIWDVERSQLKQEYVPNLHLSTPCTALKWLLLGAGSKKRKSLPTEGTLHIVLGTNKGGLALYSYAQATIVTAFTGDGHAGPVTGIAHDGGNMLFTSGHDAKVIKWNIKKCQQDSIFDCGPEKPSAVCVLENGHIVTASKGIKVWDCESQKIVQTFTGHSSNVIILQSFVHQDETFILSASKTDRNLSLWKFSLDDQRTNAFATFTLLNNSPNCVDFRLDDDHLQVACICKNDSMAFFDTNLTTVKSKKPIKSKFTLEIASDGKGNVEHISVTAVAIGGDELHIGYGDIAMKFELVPIDQKDKNIILVRADPSKMNVIVKQKEKDDMKQALNIVTPTTGVNFEILNVVQATRKSYKSVEIPLETRLDNLTVGESRKPNAKKLTHQLMQALHGNDANMLRNVLRQTDEETIGLTVKYLPSQYVASFVHELSLLMTRKTAGSEMALAWLRHLIQTHASSLMAYGIDNLNTTFGTCLGIIDHRTYNLPGLTRLRGRLELLVRQLKLNSDVDDEVHTENLLVYEDSDDESIDVKSASSDDDIFDEFEDDDDGSGKDEKMNGNNVDPDNEDVEEMDVSGSD